MPKIMKNGIEYGGGGITKLYEVSGTLTSQSTYKIKTISIDANILAQYSYLILVLYRTTTEQYGTYVPYLQTMCPSSELLINDENYHYIQVSSLPSNPTNGYMAQVARAEMSFIDYTNTLTKGKAVLYGMN